MSVLDDLRERGITVIENDRCPPGMVYVMPPPTCEVIFAPPPAEGTEARAEWEEKVREVTRGLVRIDFSKWASL